MGKRYPAFRSYWRIQAILAGFFNLLACNSAASDLSCLPVHTVTLVDSTYQSTQSAIKSGFLLSRRSEGHFVTEATATYRISPAGEVEVEFRYPEHEGMVGLPYQVFAVELKLVGQTEYFVDLSQGCRAPGLALYPGQRFQLPPGKISESAKQSCVHECSLLLRVWGQL